LIVKLPGNANIQNEVRAIVETVDLYPTILEFCGIAPPYKLDGESLMNLMKSNSSVSKSNAFGYFNNGISLRTDRYRLTKFYRNEKPNLELYDHSNDPEENQNIAEEYSVLSLF
jgi:arylsulfatase A-like enzyme